MAATGLMALSVAAFAAAAVMLADPFDGGGGDPQGRIGALPFAAVADYDPDGDDRENRSSIGLSHDGDPTTAWSTEGYATPDFRGFRKEGVGVLMRLAEPARATELIVESPTPGAPFLVLSAADAQGNRTELASGELAGGRQTVTLTTDGPRAVYLLWLTGLVEDPDAGKDNPFRVRIGEVELRGVANP
jgi:hypothetical protein